MMCWFGFCNNRLFFPLATNPNSIMTAFVQRFHSSDVIEMLNESESV